MVIEALQVLGQVAPAATTLTALYTVPSSTAASISSIIVCNQNSSGTGAFRVSIAVGGAADDPKQYIYYDLPLISNDTFIATVGISLAAGDIVRVQASSANFSFSVYGVQVA